MSILVVGSVALDTIQTPLGKAKEVLGGSASYFSVAASFFSSVNLVAVVGSDFPQKYINIFRKRNIDLKGLEIKDGKTFRWKGRYKWDFNEAETISTKLNVFSNFNPRIPEKYRKSKYIFLANIDPQIQEKVLAQVRKPKLVVADTMNYWIEKKPKYLAKLLKKIDIFLLNDSEARQLTGQVNLGEAGRAILKLGPKRVIIKKGEHGALLFSEDIVFSLPGFLMKSVFDPTGAGDTFAGGFVGYLAYSEIINQTTLKKAMVYGSIMATFAVENFSLRRLISVKWADITKRFREFKKLTHF